MYNLYQKIAIWFFVLALIVIGLAGYLYGKENDGPAYRKINEIFNQVEFWNEDQIRTESELVQTTDQLILEEITNEHQVNFTWRYLGQDYSMTLDLSKDLYEQYKNSNKRYQYTGNLPPNWIEEYYAMFFKLKPEDNSIKQLAEKLTVLAEGHLLTSDQLVELTIAFVQSIPYDRERAVNIIDKVDGDFTNYPYESLYTKTGICFDKTFLAILILRELGYGTAVLDYSEDNHSAIGIACPKEYSIYASGYCYAESTNFFPVGVIPQKEETGIAYDKSLASFAGQFDNIFNPTSLGKANILHKTEGKLYYGLEKTYYKMKRIKQLETAVEQGRLDIDKEEAVAESKLAEIDQLKIKLDNYKDRGNFDSYNKMLPEYNSKIKAYNDLVGLIELKVKLLNEKVNEYNLLVNEFVIAEE
ncbi:MAG: hypothetical protein V1865_03105 [bacterium]